MGEENKQSMEDQIAFLTRQLNELQTRVEHQKEEKPAPAPAPVEIAPGQTQEKLKAPVIDTEEPEDISEEILSWASKAALLPRLAALCFMLVFALVLRTLTDNQLIGTGVGSFIGVGYAAALMIAAWVLYEKKSPLAPVFAACGAVLIGTIVVETHMRFKSLPLIPAYFTLMAAGSWLTILSYRSRDFIPVSIGTLAMCLAGAAIDYPHPFFPYLGMILITANLLGFYAASLKRCSWLRWIVLIVTLLMMQLWGMRVAITASKQLPATPDLAIDWVLPFIGILACTFSLLSIMGITRSGSGRVSRFDFSLPTISVLWTFLVARHVISSQGSDLATLGYITVLFALLHGGAAWFLAKRKVIGAPGTNAFTCAAIILLALGLPLAFGSTLAALPLLSLAAGGIALLSTQWESGGVRLTSYLLQAYVTATLALQIMHPEKGTPSWLLISIPAVAAALALVHFLWARRTAPPEGSAVFQTDHHDLGASIVLMSALISIFFVARSIMALLIGTEPGAAASAFQGGQTVAINAGAIALILLAHQKCNKELRNIAILITVIGAFKVFMVDLVHVKGMPVVLSVFSFGLSAAVESVVLGRWQKRCKMEQKPEDESPPA